jgi:hypothetical protein
MSGLLRKLFLPFDFLTDTSQVGVGQNLGLTSAHVAGKVFVQPHPLQRNFTFCI